MKKRYIFLTLTLCFFGAIYTNAQTWTQQGSDIDGEAANDNSGRNVSLSSDGSTVAIGGYRNDGNGTNSGHVRIYENISGTWTQVGSDIDGEAAYDQSGWSVSLSSDGSTVAIGAIQNDDNGTNSGHVRIYKNISGTWTQQGSDIDGEAANDLSGWSVSLSSDGSTVAIGAIQNDGNGTNSGHVRIFKNTSGTWTKIGSDIDGEAAGDQSGWSVSLSSDGSTVAIGTRYNDGNGTDAGHVRIYKNISGTWTQVGSDIDGEAAGDGSGWSVSLSSDGSIVAIGANYNDGNGTNSGHVRIFKNTSGTWTKIGSDIDGEAAGDSSGVSVSLSSDGSTVAIGATFNDGNGSNAGHVRIYSPCTTTSSTDTITSCGAYTWTNGVTYTTSNNTATDTFVNAAGCDSIVTLNLRNISIPQDTVLIDQFTMTFNSSYSHNTPSLHSDSAYLLVASGRYGVADRWSHADAAFNYAVNIANNKVRCNGTQVPQKYMWWKFNGNVNFTRPLNDTDNNCCFCGGANKTYIWRLSSYSGVQNLSFTDGAYGDNSGSLSFKLYALRNYSAVTYSTDTISSCGSYTWTNGVTYTSSNITATDTFVNMAGCDSIVTLNLTISGIPANGLIGYWPFNGNANDESGNGNNGTVNGASLTDDRYGDSNSAYYFDGVNDYIDCGDSLLGATTTQSITVNSWVKMQDSLSGMVISKYQNLDASKSNYFMSFDRLNSRLRLTGRGTNVVDGSFVSTGDWLMLTAIYQNGTNSSKIYVNGSYINQGSLNFNSYQAVAKTLIGRNAGSPPNYFKGKIDDIGIWNRALNATEIAGLYSAGTVTYSTDTITSCGPYTWTNGVTYTTSNSTATDTFVNALGCDSIVTLNLTVLSSVTDTVLVDQFTMTFRSAFSRNSISLSSDSSYLLKVTGRYGYADGYSHNDAAWNYRWGANNNKTTCANGDIVPRKSIVWQSNNITNRRPINDSHNLADYCSGNDKEYIWTLDSLSGTQNFSFVDGGGYGDNRGSLDFKIYVLRTSDPVSYSTDTITSCGPYTWTNNVTYTTSNNTATDTFVNAAGCDSIVTLNLTLDLIKPTVVTQNLTVSLDATGSGSITATQVDNGSTDNCTIATRTLSKSSFDCSDVGTNTIWLRVTDVNGNVDSASAVITVQDVIKPTVVSTPSDIALGYCDAAYTYPLPTATDNCGVTVTQVAGLASGSVFPVGITTNTFEIKDPSGNTVTTSFTVDIRDRYLPFTLTDLSLCENEPQLDLNQGFDKITFSGNGMQSDGITFNPIISGPGVFIIQASFIDSMGCTTFEQFNVEVRPSPVTPFIRRVASDQIVTAREYDKYQWYRNGIALEDETEQLLRVYELGIYSVLVGNTEKCFANSEGYGFGMPVNQEQVTNQGTVKVYPNPTEGLIFIEMSDGDLIHNLSITNGLGVEVLTQVANTGVARMDMSSLPPGTYFLQITSTSTNASVKLVKM